MNEQEKAQALKISHLWKELVEKGTWFEFHHCRKGWLRAARCPDMESKLTLWRVAKPEKKIIDLTKCIINTIDMEFTCHDGKWSIGVLEKIFSPLSSHNYPYTKLNGGTFNCCRVRQNHIHFYNGEGNPLPDGLLVKLYFYDDSESPAFYKSQDICDHTYNLKGFEVIGMLPEYRYEWEKE